MMKPYLIDIPVALIFFNRPDTFDKVFNAVAQARPSKLFLIQDGPRKNKAGEEAKVLACRNLINIDWQCDVEYLYAKENLGCGLRIYTGITEAFKKVDRLVIIEDDIIIGDDMLPFCAELLEKYKNDERVGLISGMNHLGTYDVPYSYIFSTRGGAIWGWATWKRVWDNMDWNLNCVQDDYLMDVLREHNQIDGKRLAERAIDKYQSVKKGERQTSWTTQFIISTCILQHRMYIVPTKNLTSNIGLMGEHSKSNSIYTVPRKLRCIYFAPTYILDRPLKHPSCIIDDLIYAKLQNKLMSGGVWGRYVRLLEIIIYRVFPFLGK